MVCNLSTLFLNRLLDAPQRIVIHSPHQGSWTAARLFAQSVRLSARLRALGVKTGDRVVARIEKSPQNVALYLAALHSGVIYVPMSMAYRAQELGSFLADSEPRLIIASPSEARLFQQLAPTVPCLTLDVDGSGTLVGETGDPVEIMSAVTTHPESVALILYTSGTTGTAKGAMLTHGQLAAKARVLVDLWRWSEQDVLLHAMPLSHAHGLILSLMPALTSGASVILLPRFTVEDVLRELPRSTVFTGVPTMYRRLLDDRRFGAETCRRLRLAISGSAPLPVAIFDDFAARTGQFILEIWGMTESPTNTANPLEGERRGGSVGLPVQGVTVRIVNLEGKPVSPGDVGQIEVRLEEQFAGYWRRPDETAAAFRPDGFFRTGDLGHLSADGYLVIVGRSKEIIITGGYNVHPNEVEAAINALPGVRNSAVFGVPHPDYGEAVTAAVEAIPGSQPLSETRMITQLKEVLASYKVPKRMLVLDDLPRNETGKVLRRGVQDRFKGLYDKR